MNKRILFKLGALSAAFMIASSPAITVFAEDLTVPTQFTDGQTHEYDNVIVSESDEIGWTCAVYVSSGTTVNVSGDIDNDNLFGGGNGSAIWAFGSNDNPSEVNVGGNVSSKTGDTVFVINNAQVTIDGDVTHEGGGNPATNAVLGISTYSNIDRNLISMLSDDQIEQIKEWRNENVGAINIGGNVTSAEYGVVSEGLPINIDGDVTVNKGAAVVSSNGGSIRVGEDATGNDAAIKVTRNTDDLLEHDADRIIVEGTIKATNGSAIRFSDYREKGKGETGYVFPDIILYRIDESNRDSIVSASLNEYDKNNGNDSVKLSDEECKKAADEILSAINYIIRTEGDIQLSGDSLRNYDGLDTMRYGETVTASVADGYAVEGSDAVTVTKVSDGVYNITLDSHLGGITLKAVVDESQGNQQIDIVDNSNQLNSQQWQNIMNQIQDRQAQDSNNDNSGNPSSDSTTTASVNNVVTLTSSGDPTAPTSLSADGTTPAREVSINVSEATPEVFQAAVISNINNTPEGSTLRIETDTVACLDTAMLESFAAKNIDVEVVFTYNGQKLKVVIPKGYDINKLLDDKGYCGFLRLAGILGSEVIG